MSEEFYVYVSSRDSKETFTANTASDFSVLLPDRLYFHPVEDWSCGLVELFVPEAVNEPAYLCSNFSKSSIVGEHHLPVLRRIVGVVSDPSHVTYAPIRSSEISIVRLYIKRGDGQKVSFESGETDCTLHFIRHHESASSDRQSRISQKAL